ncbi:hypothetical protein B0H14DRAFT_782268 [Mycena olivaceomarginata]|nr:hypothetical protein B0H14DRAFT_782268 [Mycena olivaceomarginata]
MVRELKCSIAIVLRLCTIAPPCIWSSSPQTSSSFLQFKDPLGYVGYAPSRQYFGSHSRIGREQRFAREDLGQLGIKELPKLFVASIIEVTPFFPQSTPSAWNQNQVKSGSIRRGPFLSTGIETYPGHADAVNQSRHCSRLLEVLSNTS